VRVTISNGHNICGKKTIALAGRLFLPKTLNFKNISDETPLLWVEILCD